MAIQVLIAHAQGEEHCAEHLAGPIQDAGYQVVHYGTVMVGESLVEEASKVLMARGAVVLCGTIKAVGTRWARQFVNAARANNRGVKIFPVCMEEEADVEQLALDGKPANYWQDPAKAVRELISSLEKHYPLHADAERSRTDWDCYKRAVFEEHQWVRLAVIAGAKHDSFARIPLTEVFVPQMSKTGLPNYDIPDEILAYKRNLFNLDRKLEPSEELISPEVDAEEIAEELTLAEIDTERTTEELGLLGGASPELVLDVLMRERAQVFLGGPGSGKSTLLHYALLSLCDPERSKEDLPPHWQSSPVPFLIELRQYLLKKTLDFVEYIVENTKERYGVLIDAEDLRSLFREEGQALVVFDGLDEVFDPNDRLRVLQSFRTFARQYQTHIVVTSRIVGYEGSELGVAQFRHYTLLDFTLQQIRQFVTKWYEYYTWKGDERNAQGLIQRITENPRLMELAGNPLLLTMMAIIYKHGDLPERRWKLYERCTEVLLEDWEIKGKGIDYRTTLRLEITIRAPQKAEILQRVSMYMLEHGQEGRELNAIAYQPLMTILATYLVKKYNQSQGEAEAIAKDILQHLRERTYILAEVGEGIFGFVHRTFMEYFAACHWLAEFNTRKSDYEWLKVEVFGNHWQQDNWQEVLLLLIAMLSGQKSPVKEVVEYLRTECREKIPVNVAFAAQCLAETETVEDQQWAQDLLAELVEGISHYAAQPKQERVAAFLDTALSAFSMLAPMVGVPQDVKECISGLQKAKTVRVRIAAWQMGLALRSRQERLEFAVEALQDKEEAIRRGAIAALEREWSGKDEVGQALAETVRTDRLVTVRQAALEALQRAWPEQENTLDVIESRIEEESACTYIAWLIHYLASNWRGHPRILGIVIKLANRMKEALKQKTYASPNVCKAAGQAIGQGWSGNPNILALLKDWIEDADTDVRTIAIEAMVQGWREDAETLPLLIRELALNDANFDVRRTAIEKIGQIGQEDAEVLPLLREIAVKGAHLYVRQAAIEKIGQIGQEDAETLPLLKELAVNDASFDIRRTAIEKIGQIGQEDAETLPLLKELAVNDADSEVRQEAVEAIARGWREDTQTLPLLRELALNDANFYVRRTAIEKIGQIGQEDAEVLPLLREIAVKGAHLYVRRTAIEKIGQIGQEDAETLPLLKELAVNDADPYVRRAAIKALKHSGQEFHDNPSLHGNNLISSLDID